MIRCLTILNQRGDTTLWWTADRDEEVEKLIEKKMAQGVTFFLVADRGIRSKLQDAKDARQYRALAIPDEEWAAFVAEGGADVVKTPEEPIKTIRKAKTAKEVASGQSVGVTRMAGG